MPSLLTELIEGAYPNARRDGTAATEPYRSLRLLGLLRSLIEYGNQLIITARERAGTPAFLPFARRFGTTSLKLLIAHIGCAISRAVHLELKVQHEARLGARYRLEDMRAAALEHAEHASPADRSVPPPRRPAAPDRPPAEPKRRPAPPERDPELAHLPSVAQIAKEIRRQPLEQVIASICQDLGITPDHPLWQELNEAVAAFGVSLAPPPERASLPAQPEAAPQPQRPTSARQPAGGPFPATAAAALAQPRWPDRANRAPSPQGTGPPVPTDCTIAG